VRAGGEPKQVADVSLGGRVTTTAFSSDGRWAAFGSLAGNIALIDLRASNEVRPVIFPAHVGGVYSIAFTPDSALLITSGGDRTARVWDPADPRQAPVVLRGHEGTVRIAGVSPDSRLLATYSDDGTIMLWHLRLPDLIAIACRTAGRQLTSEEAHDFLGDETSRLPCAEQLTQAE
jgi:WD40 repeat protein